MSSKNNQPSIRIFNETTNLFSYKILFLTYFCTRVLFLVTAIRLRQLMLELFVFLHQSKNAVRSSVLSIAILKNDNQLSFLILDALP